MDEILKRETAKIIFMKNLLSSKYHKEDNLPNYFDGPSGKFSRVNLMGILISKDSQTLVLDDSSASIEIRSFNEIDSSGFEIGDTLNIIGKPREFNGIIFVIPEIIKKIFNPDFIEYRQLELSFYDSPLKIKDSQKSSSSFSPKIIVTCNKSETDELNILGDTIVDETEIQKLPVNFDNGKISIPITAIEKTIINSEKKDQIQEQMEKPENAYSKIIVKIQELDSGDGVFIEDIISSLNISDCEIKIRKLLEKGDIFEIRPGKIKVL